VGWKSFATIGVGGTALSQAHLNFIKKFYDVWPTTDPDDGQPYQLSRALTRAAFNDSGGRITDLDTQAIIHGAPQLKFID
jgi:hypothetical protein